MGVCTRNTGGLRKEYLWVLYRCTHITRLLTPFNTPYGWIWYSLHNLSHLLIYLPHSIILSPLYQHSEPEISVRWDHSTSEEGPGHQISCCKANTTGDSKPLCAVLCCVVLYCAACYSMICVNFNCYVSTMCIDRCPIVLTLVVNCCCCESTATTNMTMTGDAISEHTSTADAGHTTTATRSQQSLEHWCRLSSTWFKHQPIMQVRTTITTQYNTTQHNTIQPLLKAEEIIWDEKTFLSLR